jgi:hypothetical protein
MQAQRNGYLYTGEARVTIRPGEALSLKVGMDAEASNIRNRNGCIRRSHAGCDCDARPRRGINVHRTHRRSRLVSDCAAPGKFLLKAIPQEIGFSESGQSEKGLCRACSANFAFGHEKGRRWLAPLSPALRLRKR